MPFTFIDLFCGVSGFHTAINKLYKSSKIDKPKCLLACDIDPDARAIYQLNYGVTPEPDIRKIKALPPFADLLTAGFPCQTFSSIGNRKGINEKKGRLFYEIIRLLRAFPDEASKPKIMIFENVKGLVHMDKGKVLKRFVKCIEKVGYQVAWKVLDASKHPFNVPQHRDRVYIVCHLSTSLIPNVKKTQLNGNKPPITLADMLDKLGKTESVCNTKQHIQQLQQLRQIQEIQEIQHKITPFSTILDKNITLANIAHYRVTRFDDYIIDNPIRTRLGHILRAKLNDFIDKKVYSSDGIVGTMCASFTPYIYDERFKLTRRMTVHEMLLCQGFNKSFKTGGMSDRVIGRFMGNAVNVNVVTVLLGGLVEFI